MIEHAIARPRCQQGFSLIEVLIAILVLGFGLLGFALMLTTSLRFSVAANERTQATNLAYDLLDQMRANRIAAAQYPAVASFATGTVTGCSGSDRPVGNMNITQNARRWQCQVVNALGADSSAVVTVNNGVVQITINWNEERWALGGGPDFSVRSRL